MITFIPTVHGFSTTAECWISFVLCIIFASFHTLSHYCVGGGMKRAPLVYPLLTERVVVPLLRNNRLVPNHYNIGTSVAFRNENDYENVYSKWSLSFLEH